MFSITKFPQPPCEQSQMVRHPRSLCCVQGVLVEGCDSAPASPAPSVLPLLASHWHPGAMSVRTVSSTTYNLHSIWMSLPLFWGHRAGDLKKQVPGAQTVLFGRGGVPAWGMRPKHWRSHALFSPCALCLWSAACPKARATSRAPSARHTEKYCS